MTVQRNIEARIRKWHVGEKATIDHLVRRVAPETPHFEPRIHDAITESGLSVETQIRKTWHSPFIGLAIF